MLTLGLYNRYFSRGIATKISHVTTPIFYPNAKPHLGHLYSSLLCDVQHRWQLAKGNQSLFTTGTDEHGIKIQTASQKAGFSDPREFVNTLYPEFIKLNKNCDIEFTRFIRTTDQDHIENVKVLWKTCWDNGYIYKGEHKGWYSISDETFYPESKVIKDPNNPGKYINTETNNEVVHQSESNYFFKLSAFRERLIDYIEKHPQYIYPKSKKDQILNELKSSTGMQDLSISRPVSRLEWGIEVPNDPDQKIYVWFDALCNYMSSLGNIESIRNNIPVTSQHNLGGVNNVELKEPLELWKNTTHVIGKDIIKFHTIYWPSFLMAASLPINKQVIVHSHWLCNGVKMSKSLGNVLDPIQMVEYYGADSLRWFLLENSQLEEDGDFQEDKLFMIRDMFVSKWGNLINRCCGTKFNIKRAVDEFSSKADVESSILQLFEDEQDMKIQIENIFKNLKELPNLMDEKINKFEFAQLLRNIWSILSDANTLMQDAKPWTREGIKQDAIIFTCTETSRILSILCAPLIPRLSISFLNRIDVPKECQTYKYIKLGSDTKYGSKSNDKGREVPITKLQKRDT
ncbi:hypothetical protein Kpol_538p29 [Vanderwaltozyma polyspora DSM 70294]|uniref:Methionine--tRNA ligase, mitochondrial n=1 Tax=Vanderwaltozyma polyspora (strain ATCC 22028 / DSM 70294 / BCRC 21397 / CBS 2163 / NBRC 10782 / NRRL Y-8283 / UCD 57-17) TaxID=436907 RepID=A7TKE2_VANPO|nr:uncharacterized protein Kpol_538p29 [Vanderwaltozyma polyspora DSM 70294]EDO17269.1 hypothetical protein Kpol_538p29 [Vanderwaltozyma polyspora DSM 70294]